MSTRNNPRLWNAFKQPTFESQVSRITEEIEAKKDENEVKKEEFSPTEKLIINKTEEQKKQKKTNKKNKKTKKSRKSGHQKRDKSSLKNASKVYPKNKELKGISMGSSLKNARKPIQLKGISSVAYIDTRPQEKEEEVITETSLGSKENILLESNKDAITTDTEKKEMVDVDIPDLPLDDFDEAEVDETSGIEDESGGSVVYGIVGAGQAGGRIAESFYRLGYKKVVVANTSDKDLAGLKDVPENQKLLMKSEDGGAGKNMRKGEAAADAHLTELYERMQKFFGEVDRIVICAGAGGGTGGGSCLRFVETAKKYLNYIGVEDPHKKVGVLLTLPHSGECASPQVADNAYLIASKLCKLAEKELGFLLIFDNDKIKKLFPRLTVKQFWPTVNSTVTGLFHTFNLLTNQHTDYTTFDPADYNRVLSVGGCMIMGMTTLKEYQDGSDISKAIRSNLEKGLLCGGFDIATAKAAAAIATAPGDTLENTPGLMVSLDEGFDTLANVTGNAVVMRGIYEVNKPKFNVLTMVTGLEAPQKRLDELQKFKQEKTKTKTKSSLYG